MKNGTSINPTDENLDTSSLDETHIREYLRIILRRKWIVIAAFSITVLLVTIHTFSQKPMFRATAKVRIYDTTPNLLSFEGGSLPTTRRRDFYQTECQVIKSRTMADRVTKRLRLDLHPEFAGSVSGMIAVTHIPDSQLVFITAASGSPALCRDIANTFADEYINHSLESKVLTTSGATGEIGKQLEAIKQRVEVSEKLLYKYTSQNDIIGFDDKQNILFKKLTMVATRLTEAEAERISKEVRFLQVQNSEDMSALPGVTDNEILSELRVEHAKLMATYSSELGRVKEDHPLVLRLKAEADHLKQYIKEEQIRIVKTIKAEYQEAVGMEKALRQRLEELKRDNNLLEEKSIGYKVLQRELHANTQLFEGMLQRMKESSVSSEIKTTNILILDRAIAPTTPYSPRKKRSVMLSMGVGLLIGICIVFFLDYLDNTIKSPDDVEKYLHLPVLGAIGKFDSDSDLMSEKLISQLSPKSIMAESIRNIRTSLVFSSTSAHKKRVILVTSSTPSEGKSFISSNLAVTLSQTGKKVLLVDADLRKPTLDKYMEANREPGISNFLVGAAELKAITQNSKIPNLSFVPCGPVPPNPSELLGSGEMEQFLERARESFDWIIIDSPPVASVTDANILNNMVDATILVIKSGSTSRDHAKKTSLQLNENQNLIGIVLNSVDFAKDGYYYQSYYKYKYYKEGYFQEEEKVG